jgi:hypothetical protein
MHGMIVCFLTLFVYATDGLALHGVERDPATPLA